MTALIEHTRDMQDLAAIDWRQAEQLLRDQQARDWQTIQNRTIDIVPGGCAEFPQIEPAMGSWAILSGIVFGWSFLMAQILTALFS